MRGYEVFAIQTFLVSSFLELMMMHQKENEMKKIDSDPATLMVFVRQPVRVLEDSTHLVCMAERRRRRRVERVFCRSDFDSLEVVLVEKINLPTMQRFDHSCWTP